ncbi:MAG: PP2C family protein-serine/threonine phosphatase, partial [Planctomycetota bacterium]
MTIRNKNRIQKTLRSAVEERARDTLVQTIKSYEEKLKISAQAVRYSLRHYADQVQRALWSINISIDQSSEPRYLINTTEDISKEAQKYQFMDLSDSQKYTIDFDSQFVYPVDSESENLLRAQLPQLTKTCRDIYSINSETKLWIYTVLTEGTVALYPSPGFWPYEAGYDFRQQPWYINTRVNKEFTPTPRIEPLTDKTVMTVAMPLFRKDEEEELEVDEAKVICCTTFLQSREGPGKPSRLLDICDRQDVIKMIEDSRRGNAGLMRQPYNGVDSLWAYGSSELGGGFPILVVPYQRIVEQANNAQQMLFRDNIRAIQVATVLIFTVIVTAVVLAVMRARNVTVPITNLADAAGKLAQGDFGVKVNIATNDELQQLGDVFNQVGPGLQERQKIKQSLELAREIQQHFLPAETPELDNFKVAGICRYCDETGGDYYDLFDLETVAPGRVGLVLGDVSGHGIPAAMLMISTGSILRNNAPCHDDNLSAAVSELNRHLVKNSESGKFMTLFYGMLDDEKKILTW